MVLQNGRVLIAKRLSDAFALRRVEYDAGEILEQNVLFIKEATILTDRIEQTPERRPSLPIQGVRMRSGHDVRPGLVNRRMNGKPRLIDGTLSGEDISVMVYQHQV